MQVHVTRAGDDVIIYCTCACISTAGGDNQTDVATGQANPAVNAQLQGTMESLQPGPGSGSVYNQDSYQRQQQQVL